MDDECGVGLSDDGFEVVCWPGGGEREEGGAMDEDSKNRSDVYG